MVSPVTNRDVCKGHFSHRTIAPDYQRPNLRKKGKVLLFLTDSLSLTVTMILNQSMQKQKSEIQQKINPSNFILRITLQT